ncbi:MAG: outer membrane protein transport protein [Bacteroidales bacterium]|nr:outer membrane protein transport protein [Bacteroidales bacterium]
MKFRKLASKMVLTAAAVLTVLTANAEGYQINSQSARQTGMGHTGTALKLGAESMLFNPAGMAFMNSKFDISLGVTGIQSKVKFNGMGTKAETDNPMSTPLFGYIGYKPCSNLAVGVSVTNPAGNSLVWGDNWAGATMLQEVSLAAFSIQPTVSYKIGDIVSIGAGLMIDFGSFSQEKALIGKNQLEALIPLANKLAPMEPKLGALPDAIQTFHDKYPAEIELEGSSKVSYGFNIGAMVNITPKLTFGVNYRSKVKLSVEGGDAEVDYANDYAQNVVNTIASFKIPSQLEGMIDKETLKTIEATIAKMGIVTNLDGTKFDASMPIPSILSFGLAYKPNDALTLTGEAQFTGWSAYKRLDISFKQNGKEIYLQPSIKDYENTVAVRIGGEYVISDFATVRAGAYLDTPPVQKDNYNPETPSATTFCGTVGASLSPMKNMTIDLAFAYLQGKKTNGTFQDSTIGAFSGEYQKSAVMPAIGLRFRF